MHFVVILNNKEESSARRYVTNIYSMKVLTSEIRLLTSSNPQHLLQFSIPGLAYRYLGT